jgi:hypothetical protein
MWRRFAAAAVAALGLVVALPGAAMAADGKVPFEEGGMVVRVSPGGQKAVADGLPLTAQAVMCMTTSPVGCAINSVILGMVSHVLEENAVCPDDQWREIEIGIVDTGPNPPTIGSGVAITPWAQKSSRCVDA